MMDRFLAWFGLARRGEVTRLEGEMETLTATLVAKEAVIERLEAELLFRRRFFDETAIANDELGMIRARMEEVLA